MMHGWQSESTDGSKGGWSCAFWSGCGGHLTPSAGCSVVWCSCRCSCSAVAVAVAVEEVVVVVVVVVKRRPKSEEIKMASGRKINLQARMDNLIHKPYNNKFANNFRQRRNLRNNTMILH